MVIRSLPILLLPLLAFAKALCNRRPPWDQRGFIGESLCEVGVILLHDVEHRFPGEYAMVLGKEPVQVCEFFVGHGHRALAGMPEYTATC